MSPMQVTLSFPEVLVIFVGLFFQIIFVII